MSMVIAEEEDADDDVEIDEDTEKEIEVMDTTEGAQARLLQLEISITIWNPGWARKRESLIEL